MQPSELEIKTPEPSSFGLPSMAVVTWPHQKWPGALSWAHNPEKEGGSGKCTSDFTREGQIVRQRQTQNSFTGRARFGEEPCGARSTDYHDQMTESITSGIPGQTLHLSSCHPCSIGKAAPRGAVSYTVVETTQDSGGDWGDPHRPTPAHNMLTISFTSKQL